MSSDEPFDYDAPQQRPTQTHQRQQPQRDMPTRQQPQPRVASSTGARPAGDPRPGASGAPGRRPEARGTSRARAGGAATPMSSAPTRQPAPKQQPARQPRESEQTTRTSQRPPSYAPDRATGRSGAAPAAGGAERTRTMPVTSAAPRSVSASSSRRPGTRPPDAPPAKTRPAAGGPKKRRHRGRVVIAVLVVALVLVLAWPIGLLVWANGKIDHVDALSGGLGTPGTTYLLAGSDSRADGTLEGDTTEGARTDTIMLLTVPPSGNTSLISLPRDTYAEIPGHGENKLNTAYAFGGAPLLVETVEQLTGIGVDHYVEIGMGGVEGLVDAVGGVELCLDYDVDDPDSELVWSAGCHTVDGETALAFARMRKADPLGDIGRTQRQQQVIQAVTSEIAQPSLVYKPGDQVRLIEAGLGVLLVSEGTNILDLGRMAMAFRDASGEDGVRGAPPIASLDYRPGNIGSSVLLDPETSDAFFASVLDGTVTNEDTNVIF